MKRINDNSDILLVGNVDIKMIKIIKKGSNEEMCTDNTDSRKL